jgi:hypothetical protein
LLRLIFLGLLVAVASTLPKLSVEGAAVSVVGELTAVGVFVEVALGVNVAVTVGVDVGAGVIVAVRVGEGVTLGVSVGVTV